MPIIPILAVLGIFGGTATLIWYGQQTEEKKKSANAAVMNSLQKTAVQVAEAQQAKAYLDAHPDLKNDQARWVAERRAPFDRRDA